MYIHSDSGQINRILVIYENEEYDQIRSSHITEVEKKYNVVVEDDFNLRFSCQSAEVRRPFSLSLEKEVSNSAQRDQDQKFSLSKA